MQQLALDSLKSVVNSIDEYNRQFSFEIFGLDFMMDEDLNVWLIEINTNPCLETSCQILQKLIPQMIDSAFQIGLDPLFPPPFQIWPKTRKHLLPENIFLKNKFKLIFDSKYESEENILSQSETLHNSENKVNKQIICDSFKPSTIN